MRTKVNSQTMRRAALALAIFTILFGMLACTPRVFVQPLWPNGSSTGSDNSSSSSDEHSNTGTTTSKKQDTPGIDNHFVQSDDYFILQDPLEGNAWVYSTIAKMTVSPSLSTDNQAQFFRIMDGESLWTRHWVKTRLATKADLAIGKKVVFLDITDHQGLYRSPESNQEARSSYWLHSRIVDTSELFKGYVMVGDGLKVREKAIRIVE